MKAQYRFRALVVVAGIALAGCGSVGATLPDASMAVAPQSFSSGDVTAMTTQGLMAGWDEIHKAIFNMIDIKHQGFIDQDEAGPYISLDAFDAMDTAHEGKINYQQFMAYATQGGFLEPDDTPDRFMQRTRDYLNQAFNDLDVVPGTGFWGLFPKPGDGYLSERQLSRKYVSALGMEFTYPRLNLQVQIKSFKEKDFKAADHLGIGKLTIGEFEDLYISTVTELISAIPTAGRHTHKNTPAPAPVASGSLPADPGNTRPSSAMPASNNQSADAFSSYSQSGDIIVVTSDQVDPSDDINIDH